MRACESYFVQIQDEGSEAFTSSADVADLLK